MLSELCFPECRSRRFTLLYDGSRWREVYGTLGAGEAVEVGESGTGSLSARSDVTFSRSRLKSCRRRRSLRVRERGRGRCADSSEMVDERSDERWLLKCDSRFEGTSSWSTGTVAELAIAAIAVPCACRLNVL